MVKLDDEFILTADENCFVLKRISIVQDKESKNFGKRVDIVEGYYPTIDSAINGYLKNKTRKYLIKEKENTLKELLDEINKLSKDIREKFGKV